jgi:hypothetical protein
MLEKLLKVWTVADSNTAHKVSLQFLIVATKLGNAWWNMIHGFTLEILHSILTVTCTKLWLTERILWSDS